MQSFFFVIIFLQLFACGFQYVQQANDLERKYFYYRAINLINENDTVTTILAYNIAYQDEKPVLAYLGEYSQSGIFSDIQINDDYIYLITSETKDLYSEIQL